jgi:uncharacterized protein YndB with AHSA1/START domain
MMTNALGLAKAGEDGFDLIFERRFDRPAETIWQALTVPARIADWLAEAEVDLRVGGVFRLLFPAHNDAMEGRIVELDPPQRIAWTWPDARHPDSVVRWELTPDGAGCRLVLTQTRLQRPELPDVAAGWHTHLEGLPGAADGLNAPWQAEREREIRRLYADLAERRGDC